jgi:hypothetical protein
MGEESAVLQLVEVKNGSLQLNNQTVQVLGASASAFQREEKKCHVISLLGSFRTGKSFLANNLLHHFGIRLTERNCFVSQSGGRSVTQGIWIFSRPLVLENGDLVLLMDCQGSGIGNESVNVQLAALACMMSSLVILNIEGAINEEHKTLLHLLTRTCSRFTGSSQEQNWIMPKLLVRSREYRVEDFKRDFPTVQITSQRSLLHILSNPQVRQLMDAKLEHQLAREVVDPDLAHALQGIRNGFRERHWMVTWNATQEEERLLQTQFVLPVLPEVSSPFRHSIAHLVDYILELSSPKLFAGSNISLEVLFSSLNDFLQVLREEKKALHIPTIVEALQQQQIESICEQARSRYEEYWQSHHPDFQINTQEELKNVHSQAVECIRLFYHTECNRRQLPQELIESGHGILDVVLETCYLEPQEQLRQGMNRRLSELQRMAEEDNARQVELGKEMKSMQIQIQGVTSQIARLEEEARKSQEQVRIAEMERKQAEKEFHQAKQSNKKRDSCTIL